MCLLFPPAQSTGRHLESCVWQAAEEGDLPAINCMCVGYHSNMQEITHNTSYTYTFNGVHGIIKLQCSLLPSYLPPPTSLHLPSLHPLPFISPPSTHFPSSSLPPPTSLHLPSLHPFPFIFPPSTPPSPPSFFFRSYHSHCVT